MCLQVNDLDLTVRATGLSGYTLHGNGQPDHLNNVEQATQLEKMSSVRSSGFETISDGRRPVHHHCISGHMTERSNKWTHEVAARF